MHSKLQKMLPDIEQRLSQPDIEIFKIGKSNDSKRRFLEYEEPLHFLGTPNVQMKMRAVAEMKMLRNYISLQKNIMNSHSMMETN